MTDLRRPDARGSAEEESWDALVEARQRLLARVDRRRWGGRVLALASMVLLAALGHGSVQGVSARADLFEARAQPGRAVSALQGADAHGPWTGSRLRRPEERRRGTGSRARPCARLRPCPSLAGRCRPPRPSPTARP